MNLIVAQHITRAELLENSYRYSEPSDAKAWTPPNHRVRKTRVDRYERAVNIIVAERTWDMGGV